jgi:hypothetical protein
MDTIVHAASRRFDITQVSPCTAQNNTSFFRFKGKQMTRKLAPFVLVSNWPTLNLSAQLKVQAAVCFFFDYTKENRPVSVFLRKYKAIGKTRKNS